MYIAGASREWERSARVARELHARTGCVYEVPWWETAAQWTGRDARLTVDEQREIARDEIWAIRRAGTVWCLWPESDGRSSLETELGVAIAEGCRVIVSGARASESVFTALATVREAYDEVAMVEAVRLLGGAR